MNEDLLPVMNDPDAEAGVLSAFIMRPTSRRTIIADVHRDAIQHAPYAALWTLLRTMHEAGQTIDPGTVKREIRRQGLDKTVLASEFVDVFREHTTDAAADVERVTEWHRRRWALDQGEQLREVAKNIDVDLLGRLDRLTLDVGELVRRATKTTARPGGVDRLDARLESMIAGTIRNLDWPYATSLTRMARPLESGSILMLGGAPGDGKSFWLIGSMLAWIEQGIRSAIVMLEKADDWHLLRGLAIASGVPDLTRSEWVEKNPDAVREIKARFRPIMDQLASSIYEGRQIGETLGQIGQWIDAQADDHDVVIVDPISLADAGEKRWLADAAFIRSCIRTCERTNTRVLLVTHPSSKQGPASLATLMGGLTYQRATDSVLYITKHEPPKRFEVSRYLLGTPTKSIVECNRSVSAFKARNGVAGGKRFAFHFDPSSLTFVEQGLIVREIKGGEDEESS